MKSLIQYCPKCVPHMQKYIKWKMVLIHTNLEASRLNKVKCIFTPRQFRAFYMHSEGTRQGGILYTLSPKLRWLWYIFWCQCSVEHILGNMNSTMISQNVKIQQGRVKANHFLRDQHPFIQIGYHCQSLFSC